MIDGCAGAVARAPNPEIVLTLSGIALDDQLGVHDALIHQNEHRTRTSDVLVTVSHLGHAAARRSDVVAASDSNQHAATKSPLIGQLSPQRRRDRARLADRGQLTLVNSGKVN